MTFLCVTIHSTDVTCAQVSCRIKSTKATTGLCDRFGLEYFSCRRKNFQWNSVFLSLLPNKNLLKWLLKISLNFLNRLV